MKKVLLVILGSLIFSLGIYTFEISRVIDKVYTDMEYRKYNFWKLERLYQFPFIPFEYLKFNEAKLLRSYDKKVAINTFKYLFNLSKDKNIKFHCAFELAMINYKEGNYQITYKWIKKALRIRSNNQELKIFLERLFKKAREKNINLLESKITQDPKPYQINPGGKFGIGSRGNDI